jgi:BirA family transcriptional regulator, biotin operon repressor / biotin---[acetyl-CoA-carboxylase] ligase
MNQIELSNLLSAIKLGKIGYFDTIESTNILGEQWLIENKPNYSVIIANEQTQGKGRLSRKWSTNKNSALAFSLIFKGSDDRILPILSGIVAVSVAETIEKTYPSYIEIKWPNDILINRKKVAGILINSSWQGDNHLGTVIGIGINIAPDSVPIDQTLRFPAGCLEDELKTTVDRWELLREILAMLTHNLSNVYLPTVLANWDKKLAYKNENIVLFSQENRVCEGLLLGLDKTGAIRILIEGEGVKTFDAGEISLRPAN